MQDELVVIGVDAADVPELLADVSMVADDFEIDAGVCGKGWKELVPNGAGGPHVRTRCRLA